MPTGSVAIAFLKPLVVPYLSESKPPTALALASLGLSPPGANNRTAPSATSYNVLAVSIGLVTAVHISLKNFLPLSGTFWIA